MYRICDEQCEASSFITCCFSISSCQSLCSHFWAQGPISVEKKCSIASRIVWASTLCHLHLLGIVIGPVRSGARGWPVTAKACWLVLWEMYNKGISARESIVDFATRTLERKLVLWVIASGATATKCKRQWKPGIVELCFSKKKYSF